jgi:hypothetical protein
MEIEVETVLAAVGERITREGQAAGGISYG